MKPSGFGVIGTGIVGGAWHAHVYHHLPQADLVAVCDLDEARAREVAERYGAPQVYTDYRELLARDDIAAVVDEAPLLATGAEAALVTRVLAAIEESARSGQPLELH